MQSNCLICTLRALEETVVGSFREICAIPPLPWIIFSLLRENTAAAEESPDCGARMGMGRADTSEIIRAKTSATRPARERTFEYMTDQPIRKVWKALGRSWYLTSALLFGINIQQPNWEIELHYCLVMYQQPNLVLAVVTC